MTIEIDLLKLDKNSQDNQGAQGSGRPGLVKKKITVKRGSNTFQQERWVKAGEDEPVEKPGKTEDKPKPKKPKGLIIRGLNKPENEDKKPETKESEPENETDWGEDESGSMKVRSIDDENEYEKSGIAAQVKPGMSITMLNNEMIVKEINDEFGIITCEDGSGFSFDRFNQFGEINNDGKIVSKEDEPKIEYKDFKMSEDTLVDTLTGSEAGLPPSSHEFSISLCEFEDGQKAVHKLVIDETDKLNVIGETSFYNFTKRIGWDMMVPQTEEVDLGHGNGSCQAFVTGEHASCGYERGVHLEEKHFNNLAQIFAMDIIIGNSDRHNENLIIDKDDNVWAIDNDTWAGNSPTYKPKDIKNSLSALSYLSGEGVAEGYDKMLAWFGTTVSPKQAMEFKNIVNTKLTELMEHKDLIDNYYNDSYITDDKRKGAVNSNMEQIEKYLEGQK